MVGRLLGHGSIDEFGDVVLPAPGPGFRRNVGSRVLELVGEVVFWKTPGTGFRRALGSNVMFTVGSILGDTRGEAVGSLLGLSTVANDGAPLGNNRFRDCSQGHPQPENEMSKQLVEHCEA